MHVLGENMHVGLLHTVLPTVPTVSHREILSCVSEIEQGIALQMSSQTKP